MNAVKSFQIINKVDSTGFVDSKTREVIKKKSCITRITEQKPKKPIEYKVIKYPKQPPTGLIIEEISFQKVYRAGDNLNLKIKVLKREGKMPATEAEGFSVGIIPRDANNNYASANSESAGGHATYSSEDGLWHFHPNGTLATGKYYASIVAYCSQPDASCGSMETNSRTLQTSKQIAFDVLPPSEGSVIIKNSSNVPDHSAKSGAVNEKFGSYEVTVPKSMKDNEFIVAEQTFHLMLPVIGYDLLQDVYLVDEKDKIVAGPVDATGEGYENQIQKITFTDLVKYKKGKHVYTIKGTIPSTFKKGFSFSLSTTPGNDWSASVDLSENGTIKLNEVRSNYQFQG